MDYKHGWEQRLLDGWSVVHKVEHIDFLGYREMRALGQTRYIVRDHGIWLGITVSAGYSGWWTKSILWHEFCCCESVQRERLWKGRRYHIRALMRKPAYCLGWALAPLAGRFLR